MQDNYGLRAAEALDELLPKENRAKAIARLFDCTPRFAKYLLKGECWTVRRLAQAGEVFGDAWNIAFGEQQTEEKYKWREAEFEARLAVLEQKIYEHSLALAAAQRKTNESDEENGRSGSALYKTPPSFM